MEKHTPHYKLSKVQQTVADPESQPFTIAALRGGRSDFTDGRPPVIQFKAK